MPVIDLNADLGEGVTDDEGLLTIVTSANVACGYHAGDVPTMRAVCSRAAELGVVVGAQVSYDDRANFGRVALDVPYATLRDQVGDQISVLSAIAGSEGTRVSYVKPHGALYNRVVDDVEQAQAVLDGSGSLPVLGLPGSVFLSLAADRPAGLTVLSAFCSAAAFRALSFSAGLGLPEIAAPGVRWASAAARFAGWVSAGAGGALVTASASFGFSGSGAFAAGAGARASMRLNTRCPE